MANRPTTKQEEFEAALAKWDERLEALIQANEESGRLTAADYAIIINV